MKLPGTGHLVRNLPRATALFASAYTLSFFRYPASSEKMLIVKPDALGDQVLSSCVIEKISRAFGKGKVSLLVQPRVRDFYRPFEHLDSILECDRSRYWTEAGYARNLIRTIRSERYSIVLNAVYSRDLIGDQIATSSGARRIVGLIGDDRNAPAFLNRLYNLRYTELIPGPLDGEFEGYRYLPIPRHLGIPMEKGEWKPLVRLTEESRSLAARLLGELGLVRKRFALVAPGAGDPVKCWPAAGFAAIGDRLVREKRLAVVLAGAPGEEDLADAVSSGMDAGSQSVVGRTTPLELAALLSESAILVGNDSGPIHLAAGTGTPAVCILGGGHHGRFLPYPGTSLLECVHRRMDCYDCNWECIYDEPRCITEISPERVWSAIENMLGRPEGR